MATGRMAVVLRDVHYYMGICAWPHSCMLTCSPLGCGARVECFHIGRAQHTNCPMPKNQCACWAGAARSAKSMAGQAPHCVSLFMCVQTPTKETSKNTHTERDPHYILWLDVLGRLGRLGAMLAQCIAGNAHLVAGPASGEEARFAAPLPLGGRPG